MPEERSLQAYAPEELQSWQVARLEQAFATGRKKVKVGRGSSMAQHMLRGHAAASPFLHTAHILAAASKAH